MVIKRYDSFLMLKIDTPEGIDFLYEHNSIINRNGAVWFCRFGKTNILKSKISEFGNAIFLKDSAKNDNRVYLALFNRISSTDPNKNYPDYYRQISLGRPLWFQLTSLYEIDKDFVKNNFIIKSSHANLTSVYRSMCNSFYIQSINDVLL